MNEPSAPQHSPVQIEVPPWAEAYEISSTEVEGGFLFVFVLDGGFDEPLYR